ncbi:retron system putative HNH endonuclease [Spirosoma fluviale]|uniref:TIGR02646 family protein n=1 Tax=Spirosoma fluviale TaxID=1597977 RepID=A0A286G162_9BACT|nr:retron system putative HNH endonuclease [Spirosoma fluviale]SOD89280.1 TIGR02646 family protein [Spirosoma fluviale]
MRKLNKGEPLAEFDRYIKHHDPQTWKEFSEGCGELKQEMRLQMLDEEQDYLCGYTEILIDDLKECHIDHFRKRDHFPTPKQLFNWDNFVVAVENEDFGAKHKDGQNGIKDYEYALILNPVSDYAETYFEYSLLGDILPAHNLSVDKKAIAEKTIEIFNLKHPSLVRRRLDRIITIEALKNDPSNTVGEIRAQLEGCGFKSLIEQYTQQE